jgi:hypothetical protein
VHRAERYLALSGFAMAELRYASGLFNLMRNLGGAVGIAIVNTWLQNYTRLQVARMGESLGEAGRHAPDMMPNWPAASARSRLTRHIPCCWRRANWHAWFRVTR